MWKKRRMAKGDHCQETALKKQSQICIAFEGARIWLDQTAWLVILSGDQLSDSFCFCYLICQSGYLSQTKKYLHKKRKNKKRTNEQTNKRTYERTNNQSNKQTSKLSNRRILKHNNHVTDWWFFLLFFLYVRIRNGSRFLWNRRVFQV